MDSKINDQPASDRAVSAPGGGSADIRLCPHCGERLLWSEDRDIHCDGCDDLSGEDIDLIRGRMAEAIASRLDGPEHRAHFWETSMNIARQKFRELVSHKVRQLVRFSVAVIVAVLMFTIAFRAIMCEGHHHFSLTDWRPWVGWAVVWIAADIYALRFKKPNSNSTNSK